MISPQVLYFLADLMRWTMDNASSFRNFFRDFLCCLLLWGSLFVVYATTPLNAQTAQIQRGNGPFSGKAKSLVVHNGQLFVAVTDADSYTLSSSTGIKTVVQSGIYRSADNGLTWGVVSSFPVPTLASSLFSHTGTLYALTSGAGLQLYRSRDDGASWEVVPSGTVTAVTHLVAFGDTLFARTGLETRISAMVLSADSGKTWALVSSPGSIGSVVASRSRISSGRSLLFGGSPNGLLRSADRGVSWPIVPTTPAISSVIVYDVATKANDDLFLATNQGVLTSNDNGQTWRSFNSGLETKIARSLAVKGETLFAATNDGLYSSTGASWQKINTGLLNVGGESLALLQHENKLYAGTQNGVFRAESSSSGTLGVWEQVNRGLPGVRIEKGALALSLSSGTTFLAASPHGGVFRTVSGGAWNPVSTGFPNTAATIRVAAAQTSSVAVAATKNSIFSSADAGASWRAASIGVGSGEITALESISSIAPGTERFLVGTLAGTIFRANDNTAQTWSRVLSNPLEASGVRINSFVQSTASILCATNEGLMVSSDAAISWSRLAETVFPRVPVLSLAASQGLLLAGSADGVYRSLDGGRTWQIPSASAKIGTVTSLVTKNGLHYAGADAGLFRSADNGASWQSIALPDSTAVTAMVADSTRLMIGTPNGIYEYQLPSPLEFPRITAFQPSDSALVGLTDVVVTIVGTNFSTTASVTFAGQALVPQSASATQVVVRVPVALLQSLGAVQVEVINSPTDRTSAAFRIVPLPQDFPRLSITTNLNPFSTFITQTSTSQRYTLSGTNVRDSVILQAPQGFDLSADSGRIWLPVRLAFMPAAASFSRDIFVRFRPALSQVVSGFITHSIGGIVLQSLAIAGNPRSLQLEISPLGTLTYGATRVGRSLRQSVLLVNPNPVSITVATIFTGTNAADFTASVQQVVLPPQGRATVDVLFAPKERGERTAIVNFSGLASGQIALQGRGTQAVLTFSAPEIQFSTSAFVGQALKLPAETVRITNEGDDDDVLTGFQITGESSPGVAFRVRNFSPVRLEPGNSVLLTVELSPDGDGQRRNSMRMQTQDAFTSSATILLRGRGQTLSPPTLLFPRNGGAATGSSALLQWQAASAATHYEVALDVASNSRNLLTRIAASSLTSSASVAIQQNQTYYWTARSLAVSGTDTLARSAWQQWQFFSSGVESRLSVPPVLDFGMITQEQGESPPRGQPVSVSSGSWRILDVSIVQDGDAASSDSRAFRILNRDLLLGTGSILLPSPESYTIAVAFRPPELRSRPYSAIAELRVQNTSSGETVIIPFQLRGQSAQCPQTGASIGNQGCPEAVVRLQVLPNKAVFAPGDEIRLQIQLVQITNLTPNLDRFLSQLRLTLDVQNITLLSFANRLSAGTAVTGDTSVRVVSYTAASGIPFSPSALSNTDGKIRLDLVRPANAIQNVVLGELTGKAVIGLRGLGASPEESITAATISIADVQWLSDTRETLDSGQVITWGDARGLPVALQRVSVTVNTCQTTQGSLVLTATLPVNIKPLAPNPVQDETTITFSLQEQGWTELELVNGFGQSVKKILQSEMLPGEYSVRFSVTELPSGSYFLLLRTPFETAQRRMEIVR